MDLTNSCWNCSVHSRYLGKSEDQVLKRMKTELNYTKNRSKATSFKIYLNTWMMVGNLPSFGRKSLNTIKKLFLGGFLMKKQKILAMLLSVLMLFSIPTIAFAATPPVIEVTAIGDTPPISKQYPCITLFGTC